MFLLHIKSGEQFDEENNMFFHEVDVQLELEHSLVSLSKWESKHEIPFLGSTNKTDEQTIDYVKAMTITPDVDPEVYKFITAEQYTQISEYINAKQTATWFAAKPKGPQGKTETVTAEVIYYWLVALNIPFETQTWHLNRLITLVKVCDEKNKPADKKRKRSAAEIAAERRAINEARRKQMGTSG